MSVLAAFGCASPSAPREQPLVAVPTGPSPILGAWVGYSHISSCTPTGITWCRSLGFAYRFSVVITEADGGYRARLESSTPSNYAVDLTGTLTDQGDVVFTAAGPASATVRINTLRLRFDPTSGLIGSLGYTLDESTAKSTQIMAITSEIRSASRTTSGSSLGTGDPLDAFVGTWTGIGAYESCSNASGVGCGGVFPRDVQYYLTIQRSGSGLEALSDSGLANWPTVRMHGVLQGDGSVIFSGSSAGTMPSPTVSRADVTRFQLWADPNTGLTGSFDGVLTRTNGADIQHVRIKGAERSAFSFSPGPFQGGWRGRYVVRECAGPSCSRAAVGRLFSFSLSLSQSGSLLTGMFQDLPVTGTASGTRAMINAEQVAASCPWDYEGIVCTRRIRNLNVSVDAFGEMTGSFEYFEQGNHSGPYEFAVRVELTSVMRR